MMQILNQHGYFSFGRFKHYYFKRYKYLKYSRICVPELQIWFYLQFYLQSIFNRLV